MTKGIFQVWVDPEDFKDKDSVYVQVRDVFVEFLFSNQYALTPDEALKQVTSKARHQVTLLRKKIDKMEAIASTDNFAQLPFNTWFSREITQQQGWDEILDKDGGRSLNDVMQELKRGEQ